MSDIQATRMKLFQVVGRKAPTKTDENPPAFRMKLFAVNEVIAKSRFWYFMHQMRKMKKTTGEILDVNEVCPWTNVIYDKEETEEVLCTKGLATDIVHVKSNNAKHNGPYTA